MNEYVMKNKTTIVCGFPGIGKSYLFNNKELLCPTEYQSTNVFDSDSSKFSWISPGIRHPDFPNNYIEHLKTLNGIALCSTHIDVRQLLTANNMSYVLVYPSIDCKEEYIQRYVKRNSPESFITLLNNNYYQWVNELEQVNQGDCIKVELTPNKTLTDAYLSVIYPLHNNFCMKLPVNNKYTI